MKTLTFLLTAGFVACLGGAVNNLGPTRNHCEIYQGREGRTGTYIFDPMPKEYRESYPNYSPRFAIEGDQDTVGKLTEGVRYCFTFIEPIVGGPKNLKIQNGMHPVRSM
ncbi:MAG: hypothetical protein ABSG05_00115 [Candidatus Pacearchaeota archaeon]|jgi:hypothetical protein